MNLGGVRGKWKITAQRVYLALDIVIPLHLALQEAFALLPYMAQTPKHTAKYLYTKEETEKEGVNSKEPF